MGENYSEEKEIARRRWRNMMISAMTMGDFSQEQRIFLEKQRRELGIPMSEASAMAVEFKKSKGNITLFGDRKQRIAIFRDILTMVLVNGEINEKEKKLILQLAQKLDLSETELDKHMEECKEALADADSEKRSSISTRIFRKVIRSVDKDGDSDRFLRSYESARDNTERKTIQESVLQRLTEIGKNIDNDSSEGANARELVAREDKECAKRLIASGVITEPQLIPFFEEQERIYNERGRVVSLLTLMVKRKVIDQEQVDSARDFYRSENPIEGSVRKSLSNDDDTLTVTYYKDTLDHTFYVTIIKPIGQIDNHTIPLLNAAFEEIQKQTGSEGRLIIMDFSGIEYLGSAAIGSILGNRAEIMEEWGDLRFVNVKKEVMDVMNLIGVDTFIEIFDDISSAKWSFSELGEKQEKQPEE